MAEPEEEPEDELEDAGLDEEDAEAGAVVSEPASDSLLAGVFSGSPLGLSLASLAGLVRSVWLGWDLSTCLSNPSRTSRFL